MAHPLRDWLTSLAGTGLLLLTGWLAYESGVRNGPRPDDEVHESSTVEPAPRQDELDEQARITLREIMPIFLDVKSELTKTQDELRDARAEIDRLRRLLESCSRCESDCGASTFDLVGPPVAETGKILAAPI